MILNGIRILKASLLLLVTLSLNLLGNTSSPLPSEQESFLWKKYRPTQLHRDASDLNGSWGVTFMTGVFDSGDLRKIDSRNIASRHLPVMIAVTTDGQSSIFKNTSFPSFIHLGIYANWSVNEVTARQNFNERTYLWGVGGRIGASVMGIVNAASKNKHVVIENLDFHFGVQTGYRIYPKGNIVERLLDVRRDIILFPYLGLSYDFTKRISFIFEVGKSAQSYLNIGLFIDLSKKD